MRFIFAETDNEPVFYDTFLDPLCPESGMKICVAVTEKGLTASKRIRPTDIPKNWKLSPKHAGQYVSMLKDFLTGENVRWDESTFVLSGTAMQSEVWQQLAQIPYGETISYGELADVTALYLEGNPVALDVPATPRLPGRRRGSNPGGGGAP